MGGQPGRGLGGLRAGPCRRAETAGFQVHEDCRHERRGADVGIGQPGKQLHHVIHQGEGPGEIPGLEGTVGDAGQYRAAKLAVAQPFGDRQG